MNYDLSITKRPPKSESMTYHAPVDNPQAPDVSEPWLDCGEQIEGTEETLGPVDQLQDAPSSGFATQKDETEESVITSIRVADVAVDLRRVPAGFYASVQHGGCEWRTANVPVTVGNDVVEWDGPIPIPSDLAATVCLEIYASFEFQPMLGNGEQLRNLTITVEQLLKRSADELPFTFSPKDGVGKSPCSSIAMTVKRRKRESSDSSVPRVLDPHHSTTESRGQLEDLTNDGHSALSRYRKYGEKRDLECSIVQFERALNICPLDHSCRAAAESNIAMAQFIHCQVDDSDLSLDVSLTLYRNALAARPVGHLDRPSTLIQLAAVHFMRFEKRQDEVDGAQAEALLLEAMDLSSAESYEKRAAISALQLHAGRKRGPVQTDTQSSAEQDSASGSTDEDSLDLSARLLSRFQQFGDLDDLQQAIALLDAFSQPTSDPRYISGLANLGIALLHRFNLLGGSSDLEQAISRLRDTLDLIPGGSTGKPMLLNNLGNAFLTRFKHRGELCDLEQAISRVKEAVDLTPDNRPHKPVYLNSLGRALLTRFDHLGEPSDLEQAISRYRDAIDLTPDGQPSKPSRLNDLGNAFNVRFKRIGDPRDLEQMVSRLGNAVDLTPDGHPSKPRYLNNLGNAFRALFECFGNPSDLEQAISQHTVAVELASDGHPDKPTGLHAIGKSFHARFQLLGNPDDLQKAILMQTDAINLTPSGHPDEPTFLNDIGNTFLTRFEHLGEPSDLKQAILRHEEAIKLSPDGDPHKPSILNSHGNTLSKCFRCTKERGDMERAILRYREAVDLTPDGHPDKPIYLQNLGTAVRSRFKITRDLHDLDEAIARLRVAVDLTPEGHPDKPGYLNNLCDSFLARFESLEELSYLEQAILGYRRAVDLTPKGHQHKPNYLNNLGNSFFARFTRLGELNDLEQALSMYRDAVELTSGDGHTQKPRCMNNLGKAFAARFRRLGELRDLEQAISTYRDAIDLTPDGHTYKLMLLNNLGNAFLSRFEYLGKLSDLEQAISGHRDAVNLTSDGHPDKPSRLSNLGNSLRVRFERLGKLSDIEEAISRFSDAVNLISDGQPDKAGYLSDLGNAFRVRFECLGALSDLEQAISRSTDAINLTPNDDPYKPMLLNNLGNVFRACFERLGRISDLEQAISTCADAVDFTPDSHPDKPNCLNSLGNAFLHRFQALGKLSDLEQAVSRYTDAVDLTPNHHTYKPLFLSNLGYTYLTRFKRVGELSDLEQAISRSSEAVGLIPDGHPSKTAPLHNLGNAFFARFERLEEPSDLEKAFLNHRHAVELTPDGHPQKPSRLSNLGGDLLTRFELLGDQTDLEQAILKFVDAIDLTPDGHPYKPIPLTNLGNAFLTRFERLGEQNDLERAISRYREAVDLTPNGHPYKPTHLSSLGNALRTRFKHLGELSDLEQAISIHGDAANLTPDGHPDKPRRLNHLGYAFVIRYDRVGEQDALEQAISLFSKAACTSTGSTTTRFRSVQGWISCARTLGHHTLLHAYSVAIGLLPQLAWIGLSLKRRYCELMQGANVVREAAAAALDSGNPETAVEWLEQGRSIVWGELFQLRSSYEELSSVYPDHAHRLRQLSTALEDASVAYEKTFSPLSEQTQSAEYRETESMEKEADRHRMLAIERDKLLLEIRALPGFERFLLHKEFSQLRASAHSGPVVILNAAENRCDALIVLADVDHVMHVPLPNFTSKRSANLQNTMKSFLRHTREGKTVTLDGISWESFLSPLWKCIVRPVLDALAFSIPGNLSRIFWCPTGPFVFLPIHAAGLYDTEYSQPGYKVFDFVVSSYVPTLSVLTLSPNPTGTTTDSSDLRLLSVRQPPSDDKSPLPGVATEMEHIKEVVNNSPSSQTILIEASRGTVEEVLALMKKTDWVHFACHGFQDNVDSGLCLADRRCLKIRDIVALSRPRGGLAFLSACQTATGDKDLADEAIHIAAGMLFAGYGGVIGTMWSISDKLAPRVARDVYEELLRNGARPDYREAAFALHEAIGRLRDRNASFVEWLPFIHVGL